MPLDLTSARQTVQQNFFGDQVTILRPRLLDDGAGGSYPDPAGPERIGPILGKLTAIWGLETQTQVDIDVRSGYRLSLPIGTDIRLTDQVEIVGRVFNVVWTPPAGAMSLVLRVGLQEA
jgi:hypothetical protein